MGEIKLVFAGDWMLTFKDAVRSLLEDNIPVLIYHGENDIIVNWMGGQEWTNKLQWSGSAGFALAKNTTYMVDGEDKGSFKTYKGFTFMKLKDAGHLVPMDQPKAALKMVNDFISGAAPPPSPPSPPPPSPPSPPSPSGQGYACVQKDTKLQCVPSASSKGSKAACESTCGVQGYACVKKDQKLQCVASSTSSGSLAACERVCGSAKGLVV